MYQSIQLQKIVYATAFSLIIIPACDMRRNYSCSLFYIGIIILGFMAVFTGYKKYDFRLTKTELKICGIWILLLVSLLPSYLGGNVTIRTIFKEGLIFCFYFILLAKSDVGVLELSLTGVIVNLYMAYRCFLELKIESTYYQGTMVNPNQMALVLIGGAIGAIYLFTVCKGIFRLLGIFTFGLTIVLLFYTSSRTIMMTLVLACLLYTFYYIKVKQKINVLTNSIVTKKFFIVSSIAILIILFLIIYYYQDIVKFMFEKWGNNTSRLLSGRTEIWKKVFMNLTLAGEYQSNINTNNDFLDWMLKYGVISFVIYVMFMISMCTILIKRFYHNKNDENMWILIIIFSYLCICMFENIHAIFGKSINIMFWCVMGFSMRPLNLKTKNDINNKMEIIKNRHEKCIKKFHI